MFLNCVESSELLITSFPSLFLHLLFTYVNCTDKIVEVGSWKVENFINGKIKEKVLVRYCHFAVSPVNYSEEKKFE